MRLVVIGLSLLISPSLAYGQQQCAVALMKDHGRLSIHDASSLAVMKILQTSRNSNSNWGFDLTLPIEGVPIGLGAKGGQDAAEQYFEHSTTNWTQERLLSVATQTLSANAVEAYKACLNSFRNSGPRVIAHSATADEVTLKITWNAPVGSAPTTRLVTIDVSGGKPSRAFPTEWLTGRSESFIIRRDPRRDFRVIANIGNETDDQLISYIPEVPIPQTKLMLGSCLGRGGMAGVRLWGPVGERCNGVDWGYYDAQVREISTLGSCTGRGGFQGVRLYGPVGEPCGGFPNWGTYTNPVSVRQSGISSCLGHGNVLAGHRLWGPDGAACGGFGGVPWGTYSEFNKRPQ